MMTNQLTWRAWNEMKSEAAVPVWTTEFDGCPPDPDLMIQTHRWPLKLNKILPEYHGYSRLQAGMILSVSSVIL